uniref:Tight adherence protein B n=1 Tax=uncultured Chloroflexota bacterium TaxID=166587 RepID=H5S9B4_9CHLR|nr:tight adherence protein B [uncultured Chloroflexota bacterium]
MSFLILVAGSLLLILLIVGLVFSLRAESQVEERLARYLEEEKRAEEGARSSPVTEWLNKRVEKTSRGSQIARELARADIKLKVSEYFALVVILTVGLGLLGYLMNPNPISVVIGAVGGYILLQVYIKTRQAQRLRRFESQLLDMLNLMVSGLRAGYSVVQAMEAVSKELSPPISEEFRRVVQEIQIGVPPEKALDNLLRRVPSVDLDFIVTAMNVQREVGGNLAEILDTISETIRERIRIKGEIRVKTSQARLSATIVSLLPVLLALYLWFVNRNYFMTFFSNGILCGVLALGSAALLVVIGYAVLMRIANIEV